MSNTARTFPDSDSSDNALAHAYANNQARQSLQQTSDPGTAANAANIQAQYPTMPPDTVYPLAQGGVNANTPGMQQIATAAAKAKTKKGFGFHSIGDFVKTGVGDVTSAVAHATVTASGAYFRNILKPQIRVGSTALSFPLQQFEGVMRTEAHNINKYGVVGSLAAPFQAPENGAAGVENQTDVGQIYNQAKTQGVGHIDTGSGYFTGGSAHTDVTIAQRNAWEVAGHAATPGRVLASIVTEPGTTPYNLLSGLVDAGVSWYGDPAAKGLGAVSDARNAGKILSQGAPVDAEEAFANAADRLGELNTKPTALEDKILTNGEHEPWEPLADQTTREAAGILDGTRRQLMPENAANWVQSKTGAQVIQKIADTNSFAEIRRTLTNGTRIDADVLNELSKANTPADVLGVLKPVLGITGDNGGALREAPQLPNTLQRAITNVGSAVFRRDPSTVRLLSSMPGTHIDANDKTTAVNTIDNFLKNAKLPQDVIDKHVNAMADTAGPNSVFEAAMNAIQEVNDHLSNEFGLDRTHSNELTRAFQNYRQELGKYFVDEVGENYPVLGATIDGAGKALPTPHLPSEYINNSIPLPDARSIRIATRQYSQIIHSLQSPDNPAVQKLGSFAAHSERQSIQRAAQFGADSIGRVGRLADGSIDIGSAGLSTLTQDVFKPLALLRGAYAVRVVGEEQARMAATGLDSLLSHPISALAWATGRKGNLDALGHTFKDDADAAGDMEDFAKSMSHGSAGWRDRLSLKGRLIYDIRDPQYAQARAEELDKLYSDSIAKRVAGGWSNDDAVPGGFTGNDVTDVKNWFWDGSGRSVRQFVGEASGRQDLLNDRNVSDSYIDSVAKRISIKTQDDPKLLNGVATGSFENDAGKTINFRSGPGKISGDFKRHLQGLADQGQGPQKVQGDMSLFASSKGDALAKGLDRATEYAFDALASKPTNYLSRSVTFKQTYWQRMGELFPYLHDGAQAKVLATADAAGLKAADIDKGYEVSGTLSAKQADALAKGFALDKTRELLYDMTKKSQFFDITRNIFPFGDAWKEVFDVWSKIGNDNFSIARRAQQIAQAGNGSGFFYSDPATGEESFQYPGSKFITDKVLGIPVPLSGTIKGANIFGGVTPGFGPAAQWSASALLPDKPKYDDIRKIVSPYGDPDSSNGAIETLFPAWFQKLRQSGVTPFGRQDDRVWNNTVADVAAEMVSTGNYNTNSPEAVNKLMTDAKSKAKELYVIRSIAQWGAPSAPTPDFLAKIQATQGADAAEHYVMTAAMVNDYYDMQKADYKNATANFLAKYGTANFLATQPTSTSTVPASQQTYNWERAHPDLASTYPGVFGLFAPSGDTYDPSAAARQFATGERKPLSPEEVIHAANAKLANQIWYTAQDKLNNRTDSQASQLRDRLRTALTNEYPGWGQDNGTKNTPATQITQIQEAMSNKVISETPAGQATQTYLQAREEIQKIAQARGFSSWTQAKGAQDLRAAMRSVGTQLVGQQPAFGNLWTEVFSREMKNDQDEN